ncbi:Gfo/Idh/MocA family protein [Cecembia calidifontis]|uniref:Secreted protein n=1 Tax=Cecembia calidifontis TaxID=1187080 RepID=A0A4Q7PA78_9BACT|nr:Gfo/Idh/MocA family oxidoreductase [Cecembia calidifontis]RZS97124.1 secreted protein [Cecembia calidifontis]
MKKNFQVINRRDFLVKSALGAAGLALAPHILAQAKAAGKLRTVHIGLGAMGMEDLAAIASHPEVEVVGLCDVDSKMLERAKALYPKAKTYPDYRVMLKDMKNEFDAVVVSTPDHTHAPASLMAMEMNKAVYCQKPLTHHVTEARAMKKMAKEKNLVTQMGIQVHSFYDYKLATLLIQSGIIGKVHTVRAWSPKNWGFDGPEPTGSDPVPANLNWNLWLGTAPKRPYKEGYYHPGNWRKIMDFGCGTLGDMGVHIFDTPYNALQLDVPRTIRTECRQPTGFGFPENNIVTYEFPATPYTTETLKWVWYDGPGAPAEHEDLKLPNGDKLPEQGAMFMGEKGRLLLPHFMELPRWIVDGKYKEFDVKPFNLGNPVQDYNEESKKHYHQFVDACLGKGECTAPFEYSARLTETILLGVIAGKFPNETLHWDSKKARFAEKKANKFLGGKYRKF